MTGRVIQRQLRYLMCGTADGVEIAMHPIVPHSTVSHMPALP
jgi:hypothetical protein